MDLVEDIFFFFFLDAVVVLFRIAALYLQESCAVLRSTSCFDRNVFCEDLLVFSSYMHI